jgi:hypothetical protein
MTQVQETCESLPCKFRIGIDICGVFPRPEYRKTNLSWVCAYAKKATEEEPANICGQCKYHREAHSAECTYTPRITARCSGVPACMYFKKR